MIKSRESKMLDKVRRWRKKAYDADKARTPAQRTEEARDLAQKLDLPSAPPRKADDGRR